MRMVGNMRVVGHVTCAMEKALNVTRTATLTLAISKWARQMEREFTRGSMEKCTTASGVRD